MIRLIEKSSLSLISLSKIKNYLRIDYDEDDKQLKMLVEAATSLVEQEIGQTLLSKIWCKRETPTVGASGLARITLPNPPILRVLSVGEVSTNGKIKPIRRYLVETEGVVPTLAVSSSAHTLQVIYQAGFGEKASEVPAALRQAVLMLAADMYEHRTAERCLASNSIVRLILEPFRNRALV